MALDADARRLDQVTLRAPRAGELSWLQHRHMATVAVEHGWDERYEAHVAGVVAGLAKGLGRREAFWVADRDGELLGCVGMTRESEDCARLRLLFVEPEARGLGLGRRLVQTAVGFAREQGYGEVTLWTVSIMTAARAIYAAAGFEKVEAAPCDLDDSSCDEVWRLRL
jgi:GNAT superfamily N-acetyltransferase